MRFIQLSAHKGMEPRVDAATKLFLVFWDFNIDEIQEINDIFVDDFENDKLPDFVNSIDNLISSVKSSGQFQINQLMTQAFAVAYFDFNLDKDEAELIKTLLDRLEINYSELQILAKKGSQLAAGLNIFGRIYGEVN
jgi:hypothetical protein